MSKRKQDRRPAWLIEEERQREEAQRLCEEAQRLRAAPGTLDRMKVTFEKYVGLKTCLALIIIVTICLIIGYIFTTQQVITNISRGNQGIVKSTMECFPPLKVYMYDIPRKYNMGLLKKDDPAQEFPWKTPAAVPPWADNGVNRQHSVEYWLMAYLLNAENSEDEEMAAVRVNDPKQADVYFVPFFSALDNYGFPMQGSDAVLAQTLEAEIVQRMRNSTWWQESQGRDHVIVAHHPNALWHTRTLWNQSIYIVADFGRFNKTDARLEKDVVAPYAHNLPSYDEDEGADPFSRRRTLLYFRGRTTQTADGKVRAKLKELLMNEPDVQYIDSNVSSLALFETTKGMRNSRFCLHPAGDTPSSCRLFDAIVNHCVPVIISDQIELPFEDELDYNEFSLFMSSEEAIKPGHLLKTLREYKKEKWLTMWKRLKRIAHHFEYQHPAKKDDAVDMIFKQVRGKVPALKRTIHRSKRLRIPDWPHRRR